MSAPAPMRIQLTFRALLFYHLTEKFPSDSPDETEERLDRLIRSCKPLGEIEETAWRESLADRARQRGF